MQMKKIGVGIALFLMVQFAFAFGTTDIAKELPNDGKPIIAATIDALYEMAIAVGGENVHVMRLIPPNSDAHHFEPKPKDLILLKHAQVVLYNGLGMESWIKEAVEVAAPDDIVQIEATRGISRIKAAPGIHSCGHDHGEFDPHMWIGLTEAIQMTQNIMVGFVKADPAHAEIYKANAAKLIKELTDLHTEYKQAFSKVKNHAIVVGHAAFAYLCRDFGLSQHSVRSVFNESEATPRALADLVEFCRENQIKIVFSESSASKAVSETLANEVGTRVEQLYTIESPEGGLSYLERQKKNLALILESLQ